ncbi:MAG TPA: hypothetical protein DCP63_03040 [Bacteroidetes bacterium]|nr:hypothetical protein [Bacteroidota bacterium]
MSNAHTEHVSYHLPDYTRGALDEELRRVVESHLLRCEACTRELALIRATAVLVDVDESERPSSLYFNSLLPRIRRRLEQKQSRSVLTHPLMVRIVSPLAVASITIIVLLNISSPKEGTIPGQGQLKSIIGDVTADEMALVILEQNGHIPIVGLSDGQDGSQPSSGEAPEVDSQKESEALALSTSDILQTLTSSSTLVELTDAEVDAVLQRLVERAIL